MSVQLEIRDGNPWWLSPDIWTVPGDDPQGNPGDPIVGQPCYLWGRVQNTGSTGVTSASVRFYWANPSVGVTRTSATAIGTAFVSLDAGETQDVLCLTPWIPSFVNQGHECVLAEVWHSSDPLPAGPDFHVPTDRHVAQRNLSVIQTAAKFVSVPFEIHNASRMARTFLLKARLGNLSELQGRDRQLQKLVDGRPNGGLARVGFTTAICPSSHDQIHSVQKLEISANGRGGTTLAGELDGSVALIHVEQLENDRVVGGLSVLVIRERV